MVVEYEIQLVLTSQCPFSNIKCFYIWTRQSKINSISNSWIRNLLIIVNIFKFSSLCENCDKEPLYMFVCVWSAIFCSYRSLLIQISNACVVDLHLFLCIMRVSIFHSLPNIISCFHVLSSSYLSEHEWQVWIVPYTTHTSFIEKLVCEGLEAKRCNLAEIHWDCTT